MCNYGGAVKYKVKLITIPDRARPSESHNFAATTNLSSEAA